MGNPDHDWHLFSNNLGEFSLKRQESLDKHLKITSYMVKKKMFRAWHILTVNAGIKRSRKK